jgi:hypothetical protein
MNDDIRIIKGIAPRTMLVNGKRSPCACTERITCAYCVQASLLFQEKKTKADEDTFRVFATKVRKKGLRRSARLLGIPKDTLSRWIKREKVPYEVIEKFLAA